MLKSDGGKCSWVPTGRVKLGKACNRATGDWRQSESGRGESAQGRRQACNSSHTALQSAPSVSLRSRTVEGSLPFVRLQATSRAGLVQ